MQKVEQFILNNQLFLKSDKLLVALSGGADSVALLNILIDLGYNVEAAHVNFKLRGNESDGDAAFCEKLCVNKHITLHSLVEDADDYARKNKLSIEMAAREIRYKWFKQVLASKKLDKIVVGHHKDDQAETIVMNMVRGTGVAGMKGMLPLNGNIARPLLCLSKQEIDDYIKGNNLNYRSDSSNSDHAFVRNKVRHEIMPKLSEINPGFTDQIDSFSKRFAESEVIVNSYIQDWKSKNLVDENRFPAETLWADPAAMTLLHGLLTPYDFTPGAIREIFYAYPFKTGAKFYSVSHIAFYDRGNLIVEPAKFLNHNNETNEVYPVNHSHLNFHFEKLKRKDIESIPTEPNIACIDKDKLTLPLFIRRWQEGDKFRPLGMKGFKKVSDFLIDNKIGMAEKQNIYVLLSSDEIVWIVGHRIDDRFKLTKDTKQVLWVEMA